MGRLGAQGIGKLLPASVFRSTCTCAPVLSRSTDSICAVIGMFSTRLINSHACVSAVTTVSRQRFSRCLNFSGYYRYQPFSGYYRYQHSSGYYGRYPQPTDALKAQASGHRWRYPLLTSERASASPCRRRTQPTQSASASPQLAASPSCSEPGRSRCCLYRRHRRPMRSPRRTASSPPPHMSATAKCPLVSQFLIGAHVARRPSRWCRPRRRRARWRRRPSRMLRSVSRLAARVAETAMQAFSDQADVVEEVAEEIHSFEGLLLQRREVRSRARARSPRRRW